MALVYLDPGHGGHDPGGVGNGLREKDLVLKIARYTRDYLKANYRGVDVRMTRDSDTFVGLSRRAQMANNANADAFVSIHTNAGQSSAIGYEDFIFNGNVSSKTRQLQNAMHNELYRHLTVNRGKKRANFAVLRLTRMPAILTEVGFITNKRDADFLRKDSNLKKLGESHAKGIAVFLGLTKGSSKPAKKKSSGGSSKSASNSRVNWIGTNDKGKELIVDTATLNYYDSARWTNPNGSKKRGFKWKIDNLYEVNGSRQYRVQDANGNLFFTSGRSDLVKIGGTYGGSSGANLTVDGYWGRQTTKALQNALGTVADGEIWGQVRNQITNNITGGIKFGSGGSPVIKALQRKVGATADGYLGVQTFRLLQSYLGTHVDGEMWKPSTAVKELQRRLNAGNF